MDILTMVAGGIAAVSFIFSPVLVGTLGWLGFSPVGPIAGTAAAGMQAGYGGVVGAGSLFAFLQSLTMGGGALAAVQTVATGVGVVATGAAAALGILARGG